MNEKLAFLSSTRFWAIVVGAVSVTLIDPTFSTSPWYISLGKFLGIVAAGFTTIKTIDRGTEVIANGEPMKAKLVGKPETKD